nr:Ig-like domain-containing protein [Microvirga antarctica]
MLFTADFKRSGVDLVLVGPNKKTAIVYNYFKDDRRATIASPEGADLKGSVVEALAGPENPGEYAQVVAAAATLKPIGRVEKVSGSATVLRNGVPISLNFGDVVAKGDVVQTASGSSLTIKFSDGTVFTLSSSARIVLTEMVYAAESHQNAAVITLVQGVIGFVAGMVAKTGDLKVETPVATMAIRGTAVKAEISAFSGTTKFSLLTEPDGRVGSFTILDKHDLSRVLASMSDANVATIIAPMAASDLRVTQVFKTGDEIRSDADFVRELFRTFATEPRQRRGSSDDDGIPVLIPINAHQPLIETGPFPAVAPIFLTPAILPTISPMSTRSPVAIRGAATEDGPQIGLQALAMALSQVVNVKAAVVAVPASLPPGVTFVDGTRTFALDPSHPAYQHLAAGEKITITVNYTVSDFRTQIPTSVSWVVTGRNDAPIARSDHVAGVDESHKTVLALGANDSDIDGDSLRIVRWTAPTEGSVVKDPSGHLIFDPGDDFRALSTGETATVSFTYTVSDDRGGTDTATASVQIRGAGTFSSKHVTAETSSTLADTHQSVSLTLDGPSQTTAATADLRIAVGLGPVAQPQMNILYVVDVSESTSGDFAGAPVGDLNQDGRSNTILDAEIANLLGLTERIRSLGFSPADVTVTVIPFNGSANPAHEANPAQDASNTAAVTVALDSAGSETLASFLASLKAGGETNFEHALRAASEKLQTLDQGGEQNLVYFLSDGSGMGALANDLANLNGIHHAKIAAFGIGDNVDLSILDMIDNTGGAERVAFGQQLGAAFSLSPRQSGRVVDLDVFVNGRAIADIGPEDLVMTSTGLALDVTLADLARTVGDQNRVTASITFADGETLTTQLAIAGALPRSTDFIL